MADSSVQPPEELDYFSLLFPLPFRVAILLVAGFWGWGFNLHYLSLAKIDVPALIRYPSRQSPHQITHHLSTYRLATFLSIPLGAFLLLFWVVTHGSTEKVPLWESIPQTYILLLVIFLILPFHRLSRNGRHRLFASLRRISIGGLAEAQDGKFGDVLLADALTSYSKVVAEIYINYCMFLSSGVSSTGKPDRKCGGRLVVPILIAIPFAIRLRQCLIEFLRVRRARNRNDGWGGQHLANALKYSTAFPVIIFANMERNFDSESSHGISEVTVSRLWALFSFINSAYSFYWDVTKDWDLTLLTPDNRLRRQDYPFGLRRHRIFAWKELYYVAVMIDLVLRFNWLSRLSPHLDQVNNVESGIFFLMFLEIARRWMWVFFRIETEWVRSNRGPAPDDILLGDFNGKFDDD
ncbi:EXS family-domain-containing protein [Talaromyces proteolyticus]|uniref:EXS family-domain-containing protein n=1 Tax=Talaromyces proteolyticus TaxID=1131652 RepID=A0AAD4KW88_9EURO|nr:EXS family-domain-containing protein [Talaromyces proteolyticus]KAH8698298.1 EXS family-domain-containing protein [Talaromyces proteolyticus]